MGVLGALVTERQLQCAELLAEVFCFHSSQTFRVPGKKGST